MSKGVGIANFCEVVVSRVGISAAAIFQTLGQGDIIIAAHDLNVVLTQQGIDAVRMGAKPSEISESKDGFCPALVGVFDRGGEGMMIVVHPAKNGYTLIIHHEFFASFVCLP